jgi:2-oxoglutarate ferredoxin oxidoreductase subunit delta
MPPSKTKKFAVSLEIKPEWCKACDICVAFCPKDVLEIRGLTVVVKDLEACNGCGMCELLCPDFAIEVKKTRHEAEAED